MRFHHIKACISKYYKKMVFTTPRQRRGGGERFPVMGSVLPLFVANRQSVENITVVLPLGHKPIHELHEALVVGVFDEVRHLVDDDVFEAFPGLLCEIGVEANGAAPWGAAPPLGLHPLDKEVSDLYAHYRLPLLNERCGGGAQFFAIPRFDNFLPSRLRRARSHTKHQSVVAQFHRGRLVDLCHRKQIPPVPHEVALTLQIFSGRFALLFSQLPLLSANPRQFVDRKEAHRLHAHALRHRHANPA